MKTPTSLANTEHRYQFFSENPFVAKIVIPMGMTEEKIIEKLYLLSAGYSDAFGKKGFKLSVVTE